jgi:hypothetical protein
MAMIPLTMGLLVVSSTMSLMKDWSILRVWTGKCLR